MTYPFRQAACYTKGRRKNIDTVVIHFTASGTLRGTKSWFENPNSKCSAHYVIGRDGTILQMVRESDTAWHVRGHNSNSIGIELVNWGNLDLIDGIYRCWPDRWRRIYEVANFGQPKRIDDWWWAPYPQVQIDACVKLVQEIRTRYGIPKNQIMAHSFLDPERKLDPGPLFPMNELRDMSDPKLDVLPYEAYTKDPTPEDYANKDTDRSDDKTSWVERILEYFRARR
jgi:N-acetyl-anhydromuramyl-L-alanine amidase AmpD